MKTVLSWRYLTALFLPLLACMLWLYVSTPAYNWDLIPYMSRVLYPDEEMIDPVYAQVYQTLEREAPESVYQRLTDPTDRYRSMVRKDAVALWEQSVLYRIHIGYWVPVRWLYQAGVPIILSTLIPNLLGFFLVGLGALMLLRQYQLPALWSILLLLALFTLPPVIHLVRLTGPEGLAAGLIMLLVLGYFREWSLRTLLIIQSLAVLVQWDTLVFGGLVWAAVLYDRRSQMDYPVWRWVGGMALLVLLAVVLAYATEYQGWATHFNHTFVRPFAYAKSESFPISALQYLKILGARSYLVIAPLLLLAAGGWVFWRATPASFLGARLRLASSRPAKIYLCVAVAFLLRFIFWPGIPLRHEFIYLVLGGVMVVLEAKMWYDGSIDASEAKKPAAATRS